MNFSNVLSAFSTVANNLRNFLTMLKRRASKRFVLGDTTAEDPSTWEKDEATDVLPNDIGQKFQMTLQTEPPINERNDASSDTNQDSRLLRPPNTGTLQ